MTYLDIQSNIGVAGVCVILRNQIAHEANQYELKHYCELVLKCLKGDLDSLNIESGLDNMQVNEIMQAHYETL